MWLRSCVIVRGRQTLGLPLVRIVKTRITQRYQWGWADTPSARNPFALVRCRSRKPDFLGTSHNLVFVLSRRRSL
jgi:hypothetical protein